MILDVVLSLSLTWCLLNAVGLFCNWRWQVWLNRLGPTIGCSLEEFIARTEERNALWKKAEYWREWNRLLLRFATLGLTKLPKSSGPPS